MKIGVTERGDAGLDLSWSSKLNTVDGAILITKEITPDFIVNVMHSPVPTIVHCTCTGWGGSWLEPKVPFYVQQFMMLERLLERGYPPTNLVLRIDPIIPTDEGLNRVFRVLRCVTERKLPITRVRISLLDEYKHVKERIHAAGYESFYSGSNFSPTDAMMEKVQSLLAEYPFCYEVCAEDRFAQLSNQPNIQIRGCVSQLDLLTMHLDPDKSLTENPQNRNGCHCLSCKVELLNNKARCPHGCLYCYWKG